MLVSTTRDGRRGAEIGTERERKRNGDRLSQIENKGEKDVVVICLNTRARDPIRCLVAARILATRVWAGHALEALA